MPCDLLLVRHAAAEPARPRQSDAARPLTPRGAADFAEVARFLRKRQLRPALILHSPLRRAVQTAEILASALDKGGQTRVTRALTHAPSETLFAEVPAEGLVALVGHEPWMGELCAWLLTGRKGDAGSVPFKKGGVAWLTGETRPGGMELVAFLPPRLMRRSKA